MSPVLTNSSCLSFWPETPVGKRIFLVFLNISVNWPITVFFAAGCPHPCLLALNRSHAVGVGWGCTIPSGARRELGHRPRTQPAPICRQESKGAAFVPRVGCSNRPGGRRRPDSSERRIDRDKARRRASASVRLRVFYWLVRGIFVSRRELSNKVTWGFWGRKME